MRKPERFSASIYLKRSEEAEQMKKLYDLEMALKALGIQFSVGYSRNQSSKAFVSCVLSVHFDREKLSRGAGRHAKTSGLTLAEVESLIAKYKSPQEIADKVGCSVATYYRHLKKAMEQKENGVDPAGIMF